MDLLNLFVLFHIKIQAHRLSSAQKDSDLGTPYIPQSLTSPILNSCKASLLSLLTTTFESKILYASPSSRVLAKTPRDFYMPNYEDVQIETRDGIFSVPNGSAATG